LAQEQPCASLLLGLNPKSSSGQIDSQKLYIQQMQRDYLTNLFRRTQQNEDIICYNSRLSKELLSVREQLKFLQHAHTQMAVVYRINENEFQV
jgi:hypothetical protein